MDRLTYKDSTLPRASADGGVIKAYCDYDVREIINRLAAYEDTGLSPEEIREMMTDWLVWKQAEAEGRLVVLPHADGSDYAGLKVKYVVVKADTGEPVENCFVLRPDKDPAARFALEAYAQATDNQVLASDITNWIGDSGKVKVLPCKVGDELWFEKNGQIQCETVDRITAEQTDEDDDWYISIYTMSVSVLSEDIGRLIFLTREEAEKALEGYK